MKTRLALPAALFAALAFGLPGRADAATTFDALVAEYRPFLDVDDPLGVGVKLRAVAHDEYTFWRGTKGLFFAWCRDDAADFKRDAGDRAPSHGDLHFGNVGTYACGPTFGDLAFGMVDFDDACELPFQIELLEAFVTARLVARQNEVPVDAAALDAATIDAYRAALTADRTATELLRDDKLVARMIAKGRQRPYADDLDKFCEADGTFRRVVGKARAPTDLLAPIEDDARLDAFAAAIAAARGTDAGLARLLAPATAGEVRAAIVGVARRTRLGSSGSQGLNKYLVRLRRPFAGVRGDVLIYLKQQVPTAAERSGFVDADARSPGERAARMVADLARPRPIVNAFASLEGGSYLVSLREPWSDELDADDAKTADELLRFCRIWGTVAGAAHGAGGRGERLSTRIDEALVARLASLADRYVADQRRAFDELRADPRGLALIARADAAIAAIAAASAR